MSCLHTECRLFLADFTQNLNVSKFDVEDANIKFHGVWCCCQFLINSFRQTDRIFNRRYALMHKCLLSFFFFKLQTKLAWLLRLVLLCLLNEHDVSRFKWKIHNYNTYDCKSVACWRAFTVGVRRQDGRGIGGKHWARGNVKEDVCPFFPKHVLGAQMETESRLTASFIPQISYHIFNTSSSSYVSTKKIYIKLYRILTNCTLHCAARVRNGGLNWTVCLIWRHAPHTQR